MRICHIITGLYAHGAERMLLKLLSAMDRSRYANTVVSLMDRGAVGAAIEALGVPVLTVDLPRGRPTLGGLSKLLQQVGAARPDLLQGWMYHGNLAASLAAGTVARGVPVVWNVRQSLGDLAREKPLTRGLIRLSARVSAQPRGIIYNSLTSAQQHERLGYRRDRRVFIPNGFDTRRYAPATLAESRERRRRLGLPADALLVGMAARFHPMKDHANFFRAAGRIAAAQPTARFVLAGHGLNPGNAGLAERIEAAGLRERVHLLDEVSDMPAFFQSLDVAVLSSAWGEGFPNVLGEAMACGIPCVATDVGDAGEILGGTGIVVPPGDAEALYRGLDRLLADAPLRQTLAREALERVRERYSLASITGEYERLYRRLGPALP